MYLALYRAKICPECGIWPLGHLNLNKNAKSGYNICYILSWIFSRFLKALIAFFSSALPTLKSTISTGERSKQCSRLCNGTELAALADVFEDLKNDPRKCSNVTSAILCRRLLVHNDDYICLSK